MSDPDIPATALEAAKTPPPPDVALRDGFRATDGGNADRLITLHGDQLRHIAVWRKWVVWDGMRWRIDYGDRLVLGRARDVVAHLLGLATAAGDPDERKRLVGFALRTEAAHQLRAIVDVGASAPDVAVDHEALDANPWLFNLPNGTLDVRVVDAATADVRDHDPADLLTMLAGTTFDPTATCPTFDDFITTVLPDDEVRAYVQSRLGAALSGEVRDHELNIAYGGGANGKTTLFNIVAAVLGEYAVVTPKSLLIASRHEHHPTDRTRLFRRRLAYAGEIPEGSHLNEAMVKELTGGDPITGRRMREDFWTFTPTHKLWLFANHLPHISGTDHGIWRRVRVVPFNVVIADDEQDLELAAKIIENEVPGVLNWLLEGCAAWRSGLVAPKAVLVATENYRHDEDTAERFVDEELEVGAGHTIAAEELWGAHATFCTENGIPATAVVGQVQLVAAALKKRGCKQVRRTVAGVRSTTWQGVKLRVVDAAPARGSQG